MAILGKLIPVSLAFLVVAAIILILGGPMWQRLEQGFDSLNKPNYSAPDADRVYDTRTTDNPIAQHERETGQTIIIYDAEVELSDGTLILNATDRFPKSLPEAVPGARIPEHVLNHPESGIRYAAWQQGVSWWTNGRKPDNCYRWGDSQGNVIENGPWLVRFGTGIELQDGSWTSGILLILHGGENWSKSTAIPRGSLTSGMAEDFVVEVPCPPQPPFVFAGS